MLVSSGIRLRLSRVQVGAPEADTGSDLAQEDKPGPSIFCLWKLNKFNSSTPSVSLKLYWRVSLQHSLLKSFLYLQYTLSIITNLQAIQVAAHTLGIPMDNIKVQATSSSYNVNSSTTGGSVTSDMNCLVSFQFQ